MNVGSLFFFLFLIFNRFDNSQEISESIEVNPQLRDFLMPENPGIEDLPLSILKFPGNYQIG